MQFGSCLLGGGLAFATPLLAAQSPLSWLKARVLEGRMSAGAAYDAARQRVVLFGGDLTPCSGDSCPDRASDETWEWDGAHWTRRAGSGPSPRYAAAMCYDRARQRVVLFGGLPAGPFPVPPGDTWEWDGTNWMRRSHATQLPARPFAEDLAYDEVRQRAVLRLWSGLALSTWEWDGNDWSLRSAAGAPYGRMLYDVARRRVVVFEGTGMQGDTGHVWEWDGSAWSRYRSAPFPQWYYFSLAFDRRRQRAVWFGSGVGGRAETWEWDGNAWAQALPSRTPLVRGNGVLVYDEARGHTVLAGGDMLTDTWIWDGRDWTEAVAATTPTYVSWMAYDVARSTTVALNASATVALATWEWDGASWSLRPSALTPPARYGSACAYDALRRRTVLFGGHDQVQPLVDTWEWDGVTWRRATPPTAPPARIGHAMTFDLARGRILLFGGGDRATVYDDTWEWDGSTWSARNPATRPRSGGAGNSLAYDVLRQRCVLVAQWGGVRPIETWEWDGSNWSLRSTAGPNAISCSLAYDLARGRMVALIATDAYLAEHWEWDGNAWAQSTVPLPRADFAGGPLVYDLARRQFVVFGGGMYGGPWSETWLLGPIAPSVSATIGAGCAGSRGVPRLLSTTPHIGNRAFAFDLLPVPPATTCVFGVSLATGSTGFGPCTLHLAGPSIWMPLPANGEGGASINLPLPLDPSARGLALFAQGFAADANGAIGWSFSNALRVVIGD